MRNPVWQNTENSPMETSVLVGCIIYSVLAALWIVFCIFVLTRIILYDRMRRQARAHPSFPIINIHGSERPMGWTHVRHMTEDTFEHYRQSRVFDSDNVCAVCLSGFEDSQAIRELSCHHIFHRPCIDRWLAIYASTCPVCKNCLRHSPQLEGIHEPHESYQSQEQTETVTEPTSV